MKKADLHPQEQERLKALENLKIMDTLAEREFDEITLIASQICQTPIALISLVDDSRQWFKSKIGVDIDQTSKEIAFCAHAILDDDVLLIPNATLDDRFEKNPFVTGDPGVRFYAGAPLKDPNSNLPIGTLCVIDHKPRTLKKDQVDALKALSNQISKLLDLRTKISLLEAANKRLAFHKTAFDNMSEGMLLQDQTGKIIDFNPAALNVLQISAQQLSQKTLYNPQWQPVREDGSALLENEFPAMTVLNTRLEQKNMIIGLKSNSENHQWISVTSAPIFLDGSINATHVVSTFEDITDVRRAQQSLIQSAKLTALGEMACGIAHEINSPLAIISTSAHQAAIYLESGAKNDVAKKLEKIETTIQRIAKIVKGLKTFSRNSESDSNISVSFKQTINDACSFCTEKFKNSGIDFSIVGDENIFISCTPTLISQVILNLLNNAFDAIVDQPKKWIKIELTKINDKAVLKITDSGFGISHDVQEKMMQPFFTTKEIGKGTGLGLSISNGIINSFKGRIFYDTTAANTCFVIELPTVSDPEIKNVA